MAYSYVRYSGNGSTTNYVFSFPYISSDHIQVRIDGVLTDLFSFLNASTIQMFSAPVSGAVLEIRRDTPKDIPIVNFADGSVLLERDLDLLAQFDLYLAQESADKVDGTIALDTTGEWDAKNHRIRNVSAPIADGDAINKGTLDYEYTAVSTVAASMSNVNIVGSDLGTITTQPQDLGLITDAATPTSPSATSKITIVATNIADVNLVADNIVAVQNAITSAAAAATSATAAAGSATAAAGSATAASGSATAAAGSATSASTSASSASSSATSAATSAGLASGSASTATTQASAATASATAAASSATASASSATASASSATQAASSAADASNIANNSDLSIIATDLAGMGFDYDMGSVANPTTGVSTSPPGAIVTVANNIAAVASVSSNISAVNTVSTNITAVLGANANATAAASSASSASSSATSAGTSASTATTKASEAATSATNAASSATAASGSATTATTQATNAASSASGAATSATNAAASAASTAALLDSFDDRYLGPKAVAPTLDNDGNALIVGALYFDTAVGKMRVYTASGWIDASSSAQAALTVYRYTATASQTTFSGSDVNTQTLAYLAGGIVVTLNGAVIVGSGVDYTASNGTSVVLASGATVGDTLEVYAFSSFSIASLNGSALVDGTVTMAKLNSILDCGVLT